MDFNKFNLNDELLSGLRDIGYSKPTPIQDKTIPLILEKKDLIGAAQTGTGKTGAFVIPIIQQIMENPSDFTQALILSPTRELAQQIDEQVFVLGYHTGLSSATIIGGEDFAKQASALRSGVDIIVATPGRLLDQSKVLDIDFSHIKYLVLDEADRMLDMGFLPDVTKIIKKLPTERQTLLFSATMPKQIQDLAKDIMKNPEKVEIEIAKPSSSISQKAYLVDARKKTKIVQQLLDEMQWDSCIIFCATKKGTDQLERLLTKRGIKAGSIHGDRTQEERNASLREFKNGVIPVIVATDVIARGIDIDDVSLIINYDVPRAVDDYIHRIGRTGRYDKSGMAVTLVSKKDQRAFQAIERKVGDQLNVVEFEDRGGQKKDASSKQKKTTPEKESQPLKTVTKPENNKIKADSAKKENPKIEKPARTEQSPKKKKQVVKQSIEESRRIVENLKSVKVRLRPEVSTVKKEKPKTKRKETPKPRIETERISKATERNQNVRKPSKGIWGLIKSFLPRFKK